MGTGEEGAIEDETNKFVHETKSSIRPCHLEVLTPQII